MKNLNEKVKQNDKGKNKKDKEYVESLQKATRGVLQENNGPQ